MEIHYRTFIVIMESLYRFTTHPLVTFSYSLPHHREIKTFIFQTIGEAESISWEVITNNKTIIVRFNHTIAVLIQITNISRFWCNTFQVRSFLTFFLILEKSIRTICIVRVQRITFLDNCLYIRATDNFRTACIYYFIKAIRNISGEVMHYRTGLQTITY